GRDPQGSPLRPLGQALWPACPLTLAGDGAGLVVSAIDRLRKTVIGYFYSGTHLAVAQIPDTCRMPGAFRTLCSKVGKRASRPGRATVRRYLPTLESLECRTVPATIPLNGFGSGVVAATLTSKTTPDVYDFLAPVTGRLSVLMHADQGL